LKDAEVLEVVVMEKRKELLGDDGAAVYLRPRLTTDSAEKVIAARFSPIEHGWARRLWFQRRGG
jgi:hypothetical protein